jgi:hypothetical protein
MYYCGAWPTTQDIIPGSAIGATVRAELPPTVAVDFDGVLHKKSGRFSDEVTGGWKPSKHL